MAQKNLPTIETLRKQFEYDPKTGLILFRGGHHNPATGYTKRHNGKVKEWTYGNDQIVGMPADRPTNNGKYSEVRLNGRWIKSHHVAWAMHYGEWPDGALDHINGDGQDNRIENLRTATPAQNARNRKPRNGASSKYLGVCRVRDKWRAQISQGDQRVFLGDFEDERDAALAYDCAAVSMHREFARPNLIENPYLTAGKK